MTIDDIAREAGVSTATVSRVLNGKTVRADNLARVTEAIRRNDFIPNSHARGLMHKTEKSIGVVVASFTNGYYQEIAEALKTELGGDGYKIFLCSHGSSRELEEDYIADLVSRRFDAVIAVDFYRENFTSGFLGACAARVPMVLVHSFPEVAGIDSIYLDQALGMRRAMDHLRSEGLRDIAFIRGRIGFSYDIKEEAWRAYQADRGITIAEDRLVKLEDGNTEDAIALAETAMAALVESGKKPEAVFACNDLMAHGIASACLKRGLRMPEDVAVVGHDNTALAAAGPVRLSSVDLKIRRIGSIVADLLRARWKQPDRPSERILIAPELVVRESSSRS
jgi:LacI family transcriptional regulator